MENNEVECDGWCVFNKHDQRENRGVFHNEHAAWMWLTRVINWNCPNFEERIQGLREKGYTVRPVCFVSPSDKRYLDMLKNVHRGALFEQMREETSE